MAEARPSRTAAALAAEQLEGRIRSAKAKLHQSRHELLVSLARYDEIGHWAACGASTCANWAAQQLEVTVGTAREWLRIGHCLLALPEVEAAFATGELSYSKVRMLTRIAIDHPDRQSELIELAVRSTPGDLGRALAGWSNHHESAEEIEARERRNTYFAARVEPDGMGAITIRLPVLAMGAVRAAVDARVMQGIAIDPLVSQRRALGHQRAFALVDLLSVGGAKVVTEVLVHLREDGLTLHDGTPVADHALAGLIDSALFRSLIHDANRRPINASGRHRHPTPRQKRVVDERHPRCVDCGGTELLEYDHDPAFAATGRTVIDELARRCPRCHDRRHGR